MKLSSFRAVRDLVTVREYLVGLRDGGRIEISIDGHFQSPEFVHHIAPAVRLELRHQLQAIDAELGRYGVVVD